MADCRCAAGQYPLLYILIHVHRHMHLVVLTNISQKRRLNLQAAHLHCAIQALLYV